MTVLNKHALISGNLVTLLIGGFKVFNLAVHMYSVGFYMSSVTIGELLSGLLSTSTGIVVIAIQFLLGLALGYILVKALKYILALIAILILGSALSIWSLGSLPEDILAKIGVTIETLKNLAIVFTTILVGPIMVGFIIGVILGLVKK